MWCCFAKTSSMKYSHGDFFERWVGGGNQEYNARLVEWGRRNSSFGSGS